ncbi:hypothetical protein [Romboutsia sp.]|uniref:hypothetical protein n=1 Tax=Romboutsia sp. TaxID=1965302 RepID=UPI002C654B52|nr:hypothetical protein [Romboutsia sp.]HSQ89504.1 hypothetical protein [Romboutsia sp.]
MAKKNMTTNEDDLLYLNKFDDQYQQILDNVEVNQSSDSETTDLLNFRVINANNEYPQKNASKVNKDIK